MFLLRPILRLLRDLRARCLLGYGRVMLRWGRTETARTTFQRVLELRGEDFFAYVHLGEIALREGNVAAAARELRAARRTSPDKFARLRSTLARSLGELALPAASGSALSAWSIEPGRGWPTSPRPLSRHLADQPRPVSEDTAGDDSAAVTGGCEPTLWAAAASRHADFATEAEAARFRQLPPIGREEWQHLDWDELERRFRDTA